MTEGPIWLPFDGTGVTILASVWANEKRTRKYFDIDVEIINAAITGEDPDNPDTVECKIALSASWEVTRKVRKGGYWDLLVIWPDESRDYFIEGPATVNLNVTEAVL